MLDARSPAENKSPLEWLMPEEGEWHERTWMAFVANDYVWSKQQIPAVKSDLISIAKTVARYEPLSMLVAPRNYEEAVSLLGRPENRDHPVELVEFATDDLWLRDTGPTFVRGKDKRKYAIDFNFNGWGNKQEHRRDAKVARFIGEKTGSLIQNSNLVLEGGCFEIDGQGTAILTKSCVLNDNRNPRLGQEAIEEELKSLLGLRKIIWLEGIEGRDITDGHTDFYARFAGRGLVLVSRELCERSYDYEVTRRNIDTLKNSTDADGNKLRLVILDTPETFEEEATVRAILPPVTSATTFATAP